MQERIAKASNTKSKQVLQEMMDYVLQFKWRRESWYCSSMYYIAVAKKCKNDA
jgi:hypothetical protein